MVTLTERAAEKIRGLLAEEAAVDGAPSRCVSPCRAAAAPASSTRWASTARRSRATTWPRSHGVTVIVDRFSLPYLEGAGIDYVDGLMGQGFTVENPNAVASCGCGKSFPAPTPMRAPPRRRRRLRLRLQSLTLRADASGASLL